MPYIQTRTNCEITKEKEIKIKERFGEAISLLGKSENWLMVEFVPNCKMYFQGRDDKKIAYVDIQMFGKASKEAYNNMTRDVSEILNNELGIELDSIYISYGEHDNWGWNGSNF